MFTVESSRNVLIFFFFVPLLITQQFQDAGAPISVRTAQIGTLAVKARWNGQQKPVPCELQIEDVYLVLRIFDSRSAIAVASSPRASHSPLSIVPSNKSSTSTEGAKIPRADIKPENAAKQAIGLRSIMAIIEKLKVRLKSSPAYLRTRLNFLVWNLCCVNAGGHIPSAHPIGR